MYSISRRRDRREIQHKRDTLYSKRPIFCCVGVKFLSLVRSKFYELSDDSIDELNYLLIIPLIRTVTETYLSLQQLFFYGGGNG